MNVRIAAIPGLLCLLLAGCAGQGARSGADVAAEASAQSWPFVGGGAHNTRHAADERLVGASNVGRLQPVWSVPLDGAAGSNPVSDGQDLFISSGGGHLYRIDRRSGHVVWDVALEKALEIPGAASKGVALAGGAVVFGLQNKPVVAAIDKQNGALLWKTEVDQHPMADIAQPPIAANGLVFVGVSGIGEEAAATSPGYACCSFRGSIVALDAATGRLAWKTYDVPPGFAGGAIWSRTPAFDAVRHSLYITTGNLYRAPPDVQACVDGHKDDHGNDRGAIDRCYPPGVWNNSILALNPDTGAIKWGFRADNADIFTGSCQVPEMGAKNCGGGNDFDFGNGAMLWRAQGAAGGFDLVGAGAKSGIFWALNPDTGKLVWQRWLGPGGENGGMQQGSATDGTRIYTALSDSKQVNHDPLPYTLPSGVTIKYGSFAALDGATGAIAWQLPDPAAIDSPPTAKTCRLGSPREDCVGPYPKAPVSIANGVMFACSSTRDGPLFAFDAGTGALLWRFKSGASCNTGAAIIDGSVYWASGAKLFRFALPGG